MARRPTPQPEPAADKPAEKVQKLVALKMITSYAGPAGTCSPGGTISVPQLDAEQLVKGGYATFVEVPPEAEAAAEEPAAE